VPTEIHNSQWLEEEEKEEKRSRDPPLAGGELWYTNGAIQGIYTALYIYITLMGYLKY